MWAKMCLPSVSYLTNLTQGSLQVSDRICNSERGLLRALQVLLNFLETQYQCARCSVGGTVGGTKKRATHQ